MSDDRGARYEEDGIVIYRASALGGCPRALTAYASGFDPAPPPPHMQRVFDEGTELEERVLEVAGIAEEVIDRQREVELCVGRVNGRLVKVRAHMDGRHVPGLGLVSSLIEVKKFRDAYWAKWKKEGLKGFPRYEWQISVEMWETDEPALFVIGHAVDGEIVEIDTHVVDEPPVSMSEIRAKIKLIEDSINGDDELPCDPIQYPCPYFYLHDEDAVERRTEVDDAVMVELAKQIHADARTIKAWEEDIAAKKAELKAQMVKAGYEGEKIVVGGWNLTHVVTAVEERVTTTRAHEKNYVLVNKSKQEKKK